MDCRGTQLSQMLPPMSVKCAIAKFMMLMYELGVLKWRCCIIVAAVHSLLQQ